MGAELILHCLAQIFTLLSPISCSYNLPASFITHLLVPKHNITKDFQTTTVDIMQLPTHKASRQHTSYYMILFIHINRLNKHSLPPKTPVKLIFSLI